MEDVSEDLRRVGAVDDWPNYPLLPVVERVWEKGPRRCGLLIAGVGPTVYLHNIWASMIVPKHVETVKYDSFEELVREWRVD